jgi:hypothetical protein
VRNYSDFVPTVEIADPVVHARSKKNRHRALGFVARAVDVPHLIGLLRLRESNRGQNGKQQQTNGLRSHGLKSYSTLTTLRKVKDLVVVGDKSPLRSLTSGQNV